MFVVDVDLEADDAVGFGLGASRHSSRRLRFLPHQAESEAYTGEIDDSIEDTLLQHDLCYKTWFVLHTKHTQQKINESTLFAIDNMYYVYFRI